MAARFDGVALIVTEMEKALSFYRDALGVEVYNMDNYPQYVEFNGFSLWLNSGAQAAVFGELQAGEAAEAWAGLRRFPSTDVAFAVENVDALFATIKESGATVVHEPKTEPWGQRTARFFDPDNHLIEIACWVDVPEQGQPATDDQTLSQPTTNNQ